MRGFFYPRDRSARVTPTHDRPSCTWCSSRAVARLSIRLRWLGWIVPPRAIPSCASCLIERAIAFTVALGWPITVDVEPYERDDEDLARMSRAVITHHRNPDLA